MTVRKFWDLCGDKKWFKIKEQETTMDEFYNANNRTWQLYLNVVRMYQYSLFANGVVLATETSNVPPTTVDTIQPQTIEEGKSVTVPIVINPPNTSYPLYVTVQDATIASVIANNNNKSITITGLKAGNTQVSIKIGENKPSEDPTVITQNFQVTITSPNTQTVSSEIQTMNTQPKRKKKAE